MGGTEQLFFFFKPETDFIYSTHKDVTGKGARNLFPTYTN